ncbi:hypothetical protein GCM10027347_07220 [Larkinella harenae]
MRYLRFFTRTIGIVGLPLSFWAMMNSEKLTQYNINTIYLIEAIFILIALAEVYLTGYALFKSKRKALFLTGALIIVTGLIWFITVKQTSSPSPQVSY